MNYLFGFVMLTKNADPDKYKYSSYDIVFDSRWEFLFTDESMGKKCHYFLSLYELSVHIDNKNKDILIFDQPKDQIIRY